MELLCVEVIKKRKTLLGIADDEHDGDEDTEANDESAETIAKSKRKDPKDKKVT